MQIDQWSGLRDAVNFRPSCPGTGHAYTDKNYLNTEYTESVNCLYLNIYTPSLPTDRKKVSSSERLLYGMDIKINRTFKMNSNLPTDDKFSFQHFCDIFETIIIMMQFASFSQ